jgi:hypothetical protein
MKKIFCILISIFLLNCDSINDKIIGKWETVEFKTMDMKVDSDFTQSEKIALSTDYTFKSDNKVNIIGNVQGNVNGSYLIKNDSLTLAYILGSKNVKEKFKIIDITENQMVLAQSFVDYGEINFILNRIYE